MLSTIWSRVHRRDTGYEKESVVDYSNVESVIVVKKSFIDVFYLRPQTAIL
jgi:hypothetical protein